MAMYAPKMAAVTEDPTTALQSSISYYESSLTCCIMHTVPLNQGSTSYLISMHPIKIWYTTTARLFK